LARVLSRPNAVPIEVYAAALRSLENVEGHDVMPHLRRALHHASPMIRMSAIRAMRRRELNEIETPLRPMLRDPDESVRLAAAMLLYTKGYHQAESTIRRIALRNEPDDTQWEAVRYLAERNIFIPETIATSLRNPDEQIRLDAFELLSSLEGDDENHLLVMSLSSPYSDIKLGAALYILSRYATFRDTAISFDQILRYNNELIPVLIRGLEIEDESNLSDEDALAIEAIANIFQLIGVQAIPHLVSELSNERKRAGVILSLARIGEMSLEVLAMDARYNPLMRGAVTSQ